MTGRREESDAIDRAVEDALRFVARPEPRPEFKARLREQFVDVHAVGGAEEGPAREGAGSPPVSMRDGASPVSTRDGASNARVQSRTPMFRDRRALAWIGGLLAAAALLAFYLLHVARPRWRVLDGSSAAIVEVDGVPIPARESERLAAALDNARTIETSDVGLRLELGDLCLLELDPHTRIDFENSARGDRSAPLAMRASSGSLRACTGPGFPGSKMRVATRDVELSIVGTAFAVDIDADGTCVCCLHGRIELTASPMIESYKPLDAGRMCFAYRDRREPQWGAVVESHAASLSELDRLAQGVWH